VGRQSSNSINVNFALDKIKSTYNPSAMSKPEFHRADERRFLDERGSSGPLAPNGLNPATIMEKAVRERIVDSYFYKEQCFGVNEADIVDRVVEHVRFVGGVTGTVQKPTPFLCLAFKLLQLAPGDDVLDEYLHYGGDKFKYLRALAAFYIRLTRTDKDVYTKLEPFLEDRRKLRRKGRNGTSLTYMDEFVDDLLTKDRVCATSLWKMRKRDILEDLEILEPRVSPLGTLEDLLEEEDEEAMHNGDDANGDARDDDSGSIRSVSRSRSGSRPRSRLRSESVRERSNHDRMDIDEPGDRRSDGERSP
jgi:pre-mRNA-splicing factor 38A